MTEVINGLLLAGGITLVIAALVLYFTGNKAKSKG